MRLRVNGEEIESLLATLDQLVGALPPGSAVAVNGEVVPRDRVTGHLLAEGDEIEVVTAVAGG